MELMGPTVSVSATIMLPLAALMLTRTVTCVMTVLMALQEANASTVSKDSIAIPPQSQSRIRMLAYVRKLDCGVVARNLLKCFNTFLFGTHVAITKKLWCKSANCFFFCKLLYFFARLIKFLSCSLYLQFGWNCAGDVLCHRRQRWNRGWPVYLQEQHYRLVL